jgi:hypothetical protein
LFVSLEDEVRAALRREDPPAGFAARVLAQAAEQNKVIVLPVWRRPLLWAMAAGLAVAALVPPAFLEYRHREERRRAVEAKKELLFALRITRTKLRESRERIQHANTRHNIL